MNKEDAKKLIESNDALAASAGKAIGALGAALQARAQLAAPAGVADGVKHKCLTCKDAGIIGHSDICPACADTWEPATDPSPAPAYRSYSTTPGEAVAGIALRQLKDESRWVEIRDLNAHAFPDIGPHDYYPVGTVLRIPAPASDVVQVHGSLGDYISALETFEAEDGTFVRLSDVYGAIAEANRVVVQVPRELAARIADPFTSTSSLIENLRDLRAVLNGGRV